MFGEGIEVLTPLLARCSGVNPVQQYDRLPLPLLRVEDVTVRTWPEPPVAAKGISQSLRLGEHGIVGSSDRRGPRPDPEQSFQSFVHDNLPGKAGW